MNLKCLICSDVFLPHSEIHATTCGHLFHFNCLLQWLERSHTCPQCRSKATEKTIHRVYLSVEENAEVTDLSTMQFKLDNLQFQMKVKDMDVKNFTEKYEAAKAQNAGLRVEIKDQENRVRVLESAMHALKEQVGFFKEKAKKNEKLEDEIRKLREKLRDMENVQLVITGSREQVNDMLRHNRDPQSLTVLVSTLKKELIDSDRRRKQVQTMLKAAQNEAQNYKRDVNLLTKEKIRLQQDIEAHKDCVTEKKYLKKKILELKDVHTKIRETAAADSSIKHVTPQLPAPIAMLRRLMPDSIDADTSINRITAESPAPLSKQLRRLQDDDFQDKSSPSVPDTVKAIKDSDSPHLRIQSSAVGLSGLMNYNNKHASKPVSTSSNKYSIFKNQPPKVESIKRSASQSSYNGLGGHSKDDDMEWCRAPAIKRQKSSTSITSAKFKKLAPAPQKKLDGFFSNSDS